MRAEEWLREIASRLDGMVGSLWQEPAALRLERHRAWRRSWTFGICHPEAVYFESFKLMARTLVQTLPDGTTWSRLQEERDMHVSWN